MNDIALCGNKKCIAYTERRCNRAIAFIKVVDNGWKSHINVLKDTKGNEKSECELYLPKDV